MRVLQIALALSLFAVTTGCERESRAEAGRQATDLSWLDTIDFRSPPAPVSALEMGLASPVDAAEPVLEEPMAAEPARPTAAASVPRAAPARSKARSTSPARRSASSARNSGTYASSGPSRPTPRVVTVKNTKRDAAIGAAAGAAIGAVAGGSRQRVKGAVIGAVVGGVAGGVIGNNVDKSTRVVYDH
ncbi:MAG: YMGG-like glycine zipper-containing protein [Gemmatimonadota bacterium]|jgi:hypothetical protein|nr:YMGG-like glycine zipper-containing protein [Gemmatimonadota bacterium]